MADNLTSNPQEASGTPFQIACRQIAENPANIAALEAMIQECKIKKENSFFLESFLDMLKNNGLADRPFDEQKTREDLLALRDESLKNSYQQFKSAWENKKCPKPADWQYDNKIMQQLQQTLITLDLSKLLDEQIDQYFQKINLSAEEGEPIKMDLLRAFLFQLASRHLQQGAKEQNANIDLLRKQSGCLLNISKVIDSAEPEYAVVALLKQSIKFPFSDENAHYLEALRVTKVAAESKSKESMELLNGRIQRLTEHSDFKLLPDAFKRYFLEDFKIAVKEKIMQVSKDTKLMDKITKVLDRAMEGLPKLNPETIKTIISMDKPQAPTVRSAASAVTASHATFFTNRPRSNVVTSRADPRNPNKDNQQEVGVSQKPGKK